MPSKYATTSNVCYDENMMTSHVRHSERRSVISGWLVEGSVRDSRLREDRVVHMKSIQDDYMRCLKQQSSLTSQLAASTPVGGATACSSTLTNGVTVYIQHPVYSNN